MQPVISVGAASTPVTHSRTACTAVRANRWAREASPDFRLAAEECWVASMPRERTIPKGPCPRNVRVLRERGQFPFYAGRSMSREGGVMPADCPRRYCRIQGRRIAGNPSEP